MKLTVFLVAVLALACDRAPAERDTFVERDSAGIRIVENSAPTWEPSKGWQLDSSLITAGRADAPPVEQLHRVTGAVRLSDGTLVIANGGSRQLLRYDEHANFLGASGGNGEGPGEFRALSWVGRMRGDSIVTWDRGLNRITVFSPTGVYARDFRLTLTENPMSLEMKGALSNGRFLLARGASFISAVGKEGVQRQPITGWVIDSAGVERSSIGPLPGEAVFLKPAKSPPGATIRMPVLLGASTFFATGEDAVHVVDTDAFAVRTYRPDGTLIAITRRPFTRLPVQPPDIAAAIDSALEGLPPVKDIRDGMRAGFADVPPPEFLPAIAALRIDSDGDTWVRVGGSPSARDATWTVFDPRGRWLGDVSLPAALNILEVGDDYLVTLDRDDLGVERVRVFGLRK
jgi:hypothetical protein